MKKPFSKFSMSRCLLGSFFLLTAAAPAATISAFTFETDASPTTQAMNTTTSVAAASGPFTTGGSANLGRSSANAGNYFIRGISSTTFANDQGYLSFTVTPGASFKLDLTTLSFNYGVQASGSLANYTTVFRLRSSLDAFATSIPTSYAGAAASQASGATASSTSDTTPFRLRPLLRGLHSPISRFQ